MNRYLYEDEPTLETNTVVGIQWPKSWSRRVFALTCIAGEMIAGWSVNSEIRQEDSTNQIIYLGGIGLSLTGIALDKWWDYAEQKSLQELCILDEAFDHLPLVRLSDDGFAPEPPFQAP